MLSAHHLVAERINQISPDLMRLYDKFSSMIVHNLYTFDFEAAFAAMGADQAMGWTKVDWNGEEQEDEDQEEQPEQPEQQGQEDQEDQEQKSQKIPVVKASAVCFPVLCQELVKGAMEIVSMWGINNNLTKGQLMLIKKHASEIKDEPRIQAIGQTLWRKLLAARPDDVTVTEAYMKYCQLSPDQIIRVTRAVINNPNAAREFLRRNQEQQQPPPPQQRPQQRPPQAPQNRRPPEPEEEVPDWMPKPWQPDTPED